MLPNDKLEQLQNEYAILHLLYHRNYNQHRVAVWWRYFDMIHRGVRKVLRGIYEAQEAKKIRRREELEKEVAAVASHLLTRVMGKAFYHFHSVIALGQFVNLGFVLVANLSALRSLLLEIEGVQSRRHMQEKPLKSVKIDADDIGEELTIDLVSKPEPLPEVRTIDLFEDIAPKNAQERNQIQARVKRRRRKRRRNPSLPSTTSLAKDY